MSERTAWEVRAVLSRGMPVNDTIFDGSPEISHDSPGSVEMNHFGAIIVLA
jgi:hypothetical protein